MRHFLRPSGQSHHEILREIERSSVRVSASYLDDCGGHPGPGGQYHYHGLPTCLVAYATGSTERVASVASTSGSTTSVVNEDNAAAKKPVVLGFAFDGSGIYDNVAMSGSTSPVSAPDACNGIFSPVPGYPHGVYHYVLENVKGARSSIGCYHGVVSSAYTRALEDDLSGAHSSRVMWLRSRRFRRQRKAWPLIRMRTNY